VRDDGVTGSKSRTSEASARRACQNGQRHIIKDFLIFDPEIKLNSWSGKNISYQAI